MKTDLMFMQNGDFREAFERFTEGGEETYLDQRRSVEFVAGLAEGIAVTVVSASSSDYDVMLAPRLRSIGITQSRFYQESVGPDILTALQPAMIIPRTAHPSLLRQLAQTRTPCFPILADIFRPVTLRQMTSRASLGRWRSNRRLRRLLSGPKTVAVGNHGLNSARSLNTVLHIAPERIVPWEWTRLAPDPAPRTRANAPPTLFMAGVIIQEKGVGDLVEAARRLTSAGTAIRVVIAGDGRDFEQIAARASKEGLGDVVRFLGRISHKDVGGWMRNCDIAVVPSRSNYPEGMPNVIFEALAARTPLILSDHPAFGERLADGRDAIVFSNGDAGSLASAIERLASDAALYRRLSEHAPAALDRLYVGHSWYALVSKFVADPHDRTGWVAKHSLASLVQD